MKKVSLALLAAVLLLMPVVIIAAANSDNIASASSGNLSAVEKVFSEDAFLEEVSSLNSSDTEITHRADETGALTFVESSKTAFSGEISPYSSEKMTSNCVENINGFVSADLDELRRKIDMQETNIVKYYDPDPDEFLPSKPPLLKMDIDTLFHIFEIIKKYDWEPHTAYINVLVEKGCQISIVCQNQVITYLNFARDAEGRCFVWSFYDYKIAYMSEYDYEEIRSIFNAAPLL